MKKMKLRLLTVLFFVIFVFIESISFATFQTSTIKETEKKEQIQKMITQEGEMTQEEHETLDLINKYRKQNGLGELKPLARLQQTAKLKAEDLVKNEYFSHNSETLGNPFEMLKSNNVIYDIAGENLAGNTEPQKAVEAWINSETHKQNILEEKFNYTGICVIESSVYGKIFVQLFIGVQE